MLLLTVAHRCAAALRCRLTASAKKSVCGFTLNLKQTGNNDMAYDTTDASYAMYYSNANCKMYVKFRTRVDQKDNNKLVRGVLSKQRW
jgi:hypothetical protein